MARSIQDIAAPDVAALIEANTQTAFTRWAEGLGAAVHREPDLTWFVSGVPFALCNGVVRSAFTSANADERIAETLRHYEEHGVPMCWLIGPSSQPQDLGSRLEAHGMMHAEDGPGMAIDLHALDDGPAAPAGLTIVKVDDGATLRTWLDVLCLGSGFPEDVRDVLHGVLDRHGLASAHGLRRHPSIRLFLGLLHGRPVATSLLFLAAGVAGLYDVATAPAARRRGIGTALSRAALLTARDLGYRAGILQSSEMGQDVYRRLGFEQFCSLALYFWSPAPS